MSDQPENLILVYLRRIDGRLDRIENRMDAFETRMSVLESGQANMSRDLANLWHAYAGIQVEVGTINKRIERCLDLHEPAT